MGLSDRTDLRGTRVGDIAAAVLSEMQDAAGTRWGAVVVGYLDDAVRELADERVFRRTEIIVPTADKATYTPFLDPVEILSVWYDGRKLTSTSTEELDRRYGEDWRDESDLVVYHYLPGRFPRLFPAPSSGGTALTFAATAPLTEANGLGPMGSGYLAADNADTVDHWLEGDGTVSNENAANNLRIHYAYYPNALGRDMLVPRWLGTPLREYAKAKCLETSDDALERGQALAAARRWEAARDTLLQRVNREFGGEYSPTMLLDDTGLYGSRRGQYFNIFGNV